MYTSILYHGFGIQEHRYLRTEYSGGVLVFQGIRHRLEITLRYQWVSRHPPARQLSF